MLAFIALPLLSSTLGATSVDGTSGAWLKSIEKLLPSMLKVSFSPTTRQYIYE